MTPPADTLVALGDTVRLLAEALDANGHLVADTEFAWASSDESVLTVDGTGLVTAAGNVDHHRVRPRWAGSPPRPTSTSSSGRRS